MLSIPQLVSGRASEVRRPLLPKPDSECPPWKPLEALSGSYPLAAPGERWSE